MIDSNRILMSRLLGPEETQLNQPLFYYLAFAIIAVGFLIAIVGLFGCWASCLYNCCITASVSTTFNIKID